MATIYTIGHGNRPIGEFVELLDGAGIQCLVDVRAYPVSRRHPQFSREALERSLAAAGIRYIWEGKALGGRRKPVKESHHVALSSAAFRAYADYMATPQFREGAARLAALGGASRVAVMCAERLPSECHRAFLSDYLVAGGGRVVHLLGKGVREDHRRSPAARWRDGRLIYDGMTQGALGW